MVLTFSSFGFTSLSASNASNITSYGTVLNGTSYYDSVNTVRTGGDETNYYKPIIEATMPQVEMYVAELLNQFYKDTELSETTPTHRSEAVHCMHIG